MFYGVTAEWTNHTYFGKLTKAEWGKLIVIHCNHHFQQLNNIFTFLHIKQGRQLCACPIELFVSSKCNLRCCWSMGRYYFIEEVFEDGVERFRLFHHGRVAAFIQEK